MQDSLFTTDGKALARGRVFIHFGDWRDVVDTWPRDGIPIFDPPYGIGYESGRQSGHGESKRPGIERGLATSIIGDDDTAERDAMMSRGWDAAAVFGPGRLDRRDANGKVVEDPRAVLTWDKGEGVGMGDLSLPWRPNTETVAIYGRGWAGKRTSSVLRGAVMSYGRSSSPAIGRQHPHEKPLAVVAELVGKAPPGRAIIDSHAGSGTALLAAALLGRDAYGAEIDMRYRDAILGRLAAHSVGVLTTSDMR
jgi:hypothetical protein